MSEPVLEVRAVRKAYGRVAAVDGVDLTIAEHELVALVGPSGCGKSTLLRLAAGLAAVDTGTICIAGDVVDDGVRRVEPEHRHAGLVFQEHSLFPHLSVADNITFGLRDLPRSGRAERRDHWLGVIGLGGHGDRYPHELSGGERQRVAIGRALLMRPRLLLLDEPLASLDAKRKREIFPFLLRLRDETAVPMVYVSHQPGEVRRIATTIVRIDDGRVSGIGGVELLGTADADDL
jgi:iron(III) transport system ATP-binding protein